MKKFALGFAAYFAPVIALAQVTNVDSAATLFFRIINSILIPAIFALAFLYFIWGVFTYVMAHDEGKRAEGQKIMLWGVIGLFVMISVWGLVSILTSTVGLQGNVPPDLPNVQTTNN